VFQGFKDWGSLSAVWLFVSFILFFFFLLLLFDFPFSLFWLGHTHFVLTITFLVIWACPLAFEFFRLFCLFGSRLFILFYHWNFHLPSVWGMILVGIFHEKKIIQAQKGTARDIFILECEKNNKDDISSF